MIRSRSSVSTTACLAGATLFCCVASNARATTLSFQNFSNGYQFQTNSRLVEGRPDGGTSFSDDDTLLVDGGGSEGIKHGVIRFNNIFGDEAGRVPFGSPIISATLELDVINPGSGMMLYQLATDWAPGAATTWNNFGSSGGGIVIDEDTVGPPIEAVGANDSDENVPLGPLFLDVTAAVQAWSDGAPNFGIGLVPFVEGDNGVIVAGSKSNPSSSSRIPPRLVIRTIPEPNAAAIALIGACCLFGTRRRDAQRR